MAIAKLSKSEAAELRTLLDAYDKARGEIVDWINSVIGEWRAAIDAKSEAWQDSDAGQRASERCDTLEAIADEMPEPPGLDIVDTLV